MRLTVAAVGRMKSGPEQDLAARYLDRLRRSGASLGLDFSGVAEILESRAPQAAERKRDEGARLLALLPEGSRLVVLDETGRTPSSDEFAGLLARHRDEGARDLVLAIGGPDGHGDEIRARASSLLAFGRLTFPHQIVRILLAEQLYRATTILGGHPYHRA